MLAEQKNAEKKRKHHLIIPLSTLLNTPEEQHAFITGFLEMLAPPWPMVKPTAIHHLDLECEYHYYVAGRALGTLFWIPLVLLIKCLFS